VHPVVAEVLEDPVLHRQEVKRGTVGGEMLGDRVLRVTAEDLRGKRVGSPEWAHSAAVYMRGWLHNEVGVKLDEVHWVQAGANAAGREEKVELQLPSGVLVERVADRSLSDLRAAGDIDCAIIARPPDCFREGHPDVVRLFRDFQSMEANHFRRTGVWPIMHIIAMRRAILDANPLAPSIS
jgi:4,5-dihydroxyphthalate decarboxylase